MSKILTNNQYYHQIADVIREQNGTSNTYKPAQMVSALKDLFYEEVEGVPPITFQGIGENLLDYRIYGASGGVGERTKNLVDKTKFTYRYRLNTIGALYTAPSEQNLFAVSEFIEVNSGEQYIISRRDATRGYARRISFYQSKNENSWLSNNDDSNLIFTVPNTATYLRFTTPQDYIDSIMLIRGTSLPTTYEPYGYKVPVVVSGKNLLRNTAATQTINGVTFTVNDDGSVTCNGTANETVRYMLGVITLMSGVQYKMSGCPTNGANDTYRLDPRLMTGSVVFSFIDNGNGAVYTPNADVRINVLIYIQNGYTCDNLTFYPMIRLTTIEDDTYEPYVEPTTTNIYLDNPIRTVGDEVEYIDYSEQKQHRIRKNLYSSTTEWYLNNTDNPNAKSNSSTNRIKTDIIEIDNNKSNVVMSGLPNILNILAYRFYDANKNSLGENANGNIPANALYVSVLCSGTNLSESTKTVIKNSLIQLEYENVTDYEPYIENTEVDVTLPAIPTIRGTNVLTVNTTVQPSNVYVKSRHESSYETAMRERYEEAQAQLDALNQEIEEE